MGLKLSKADNNLPNTLTQSQVQSHQQDPKILAEISKQKITAVSENAFGALRKRILKRTIDLNDPRSPNSQLNRTPLVFEDRSDRTLNLDDTFADLFIESKTKKEKLESLTEGCVSNEMNTFLENKMEKSLPSKSKFSFEIETYCEEETMICPVVLKKTPKFEKTIDPRSPTIGLDRTPLVFSDSEVCDEEMLEDAIAVLSIEKSSTSINPLEENAEKSDQEQNQSFVFKLENKHLNNVRSGKKRASKPGSPNRTPKQKIYEDIENRQTSTPKIKSFIKRYEGGIENKRTPLSCVKNRPHTQRSRSVESSSKTIKARMPLTSFDDNLNPNESVKVMDLRILQCSQDSIEF